MRNGVNLTYIASLTLRTVNKLYIYPETTGVVLQKYPEKPPYILDFKMEQNLVQKAVIQTNFGLVIWILSLEVKQNEARIIQYITFRLVISLLML